MKNRSKKPTHFYFGGRKFIEAGAALKKNLKDPEFKLEYEKLLEEENGTRKENRR